MKRVVVLGLMGQYPFGGMAWQVIHHVLGFERLGVECFYVENSGAPPYSPRLQSVNDSAGENVRFLADTFARHGLADRWVYWDSLTDEWPGMGKAKADELLREADVIVNLCGASRPDPELKRKGCLVYIETDPILEQFKIAGGDLQSRAYLESHDLLFTYGIRIGDPRCRVPSVGIPWRKTHPPVIVDLWQSQPPARAPWRTIATYRNKGKDVVVDGRTYHWSKHPNFERVMDLPKRTPETLEIALVTAGENAVRERFLANGWKLEDPVAISSDPDVYRAYIQGARGEFSVEKEDQTELKVGWFSDRSVCFLAAGRPCVLQDTGIGEVIALGEGLLEWNTPQEAIEALARVSADYERHCAAAVRVAREHFEASVLLPPMLEAAGVSPKS
jgi:hypothetical protein